MDRAPRPPMKRSAGAQQLDTLRAGRPARTFARDLGLGVSHTTVWWWYRSMKKPDAEHRIALRDRLGIEVDAWDLEATS